MLPLIVACEATTTAAPTDTARDTAEDSASDSAADSNADSAGLPGIGLRAPSENTTWFLDTRYDIVATVNDADTASCTVSGAEFTCDPLTDGVLHCSVIPRTAATITVAVSATGAGGTSTASVGVVARAAEGIVPEGEQFAMGMYEVMDESWFVPVVSGQFNIVQSYGTGGYTQEQWQEWSASAGVLTMTRPGWNWADPWEMSSRETLDWLAARPEIGWWEVPELPVEDDSYVEEVASVVSLIREFDDRPTQMYFWTSTIAEDIAPYVPFVHVISPGAYPEHACQPQPWIRWRITSASEGVAMAGYTPAERPVVGTADLYGQPEASCPERVAQLEQVRMNPLAMIAAGAQGVIYFAWWYAANSLDAAWGDSALETGTLIMGEAGLGYAAVHGEPLGDLAVTVTSGPTTSEPFTPAQTTTAIEYPSIHAAGWDYAGTRFVVAVNYTNEAITAKIGGFPAVTTGVEVVGEGRSLSSTGGWVEESFGAWGAHVYRAPIVSE